MLTRLYIDNFRCFVNFEYKPGRRSLILGRNGSGKSSLLDALFSLQQFVLDGQPAKKAFPLSHRTRWLDKSAQKFELEVQLKSGKCSYELVIEPAGREPRVASESIRLDGNPLVEFNNGEVKLYSNESQAAYEYPLDPSRSALLTISASKNNLILPFKKWLANIYCFRLNPFEMGSVAEGEDLQPEVDLSNIAAWYRHLLQTYPGLYEDLRKSLGTALDGFDSLQLEPSGEDKLLLAQFRLNNRRSIKLRFKQLSDGQRCLICLYVILHFVLAKGKTVILDEPENFISLQEIQPWLMAVSDVIDEGKGQILLISHHPELINQWAPSYGVQLVRDGVGPVRIEQFKGDPDSTLPPAELIARGWERG